jgi:DNA polymerase delta subunit 2
MYFARLAVLKPVVERVASEAWDGFEVSNTTNPLAREC